MFEQQIIDNTDARFPGQQLIAGYRDGVEVWRSWLPEEVPIEARLNLDHPEASDRRKGAPKGQKVRWKMPDAEVFALIDGDSDGRAEDRRADLRAEAQERGIDVATEVKPRRNVRPGDASPTA